MQPSETQPQRTVPSSLLAIASTALGSIVKHVPLRGLLWGFLGLVVGIVGVMLSFPATLLTFDRAAALMAEFPFIVIPLSLPLVSSAVLGMHGLHRGAARAALELEQKFGLVRHVLDRVFAYLHARFGRSLANMPVGDAEKVVKDAIAAYLGEDGDAGSGISGFVIRKARTKILAKVDDVFLVAFRAEAGAAGPGGGVDLDKIHARVLADLQAKAAEVFGGALNKQAALFVGGSLLVCTFWFHAIIGIFALLGRALGGPS